MILMPFGKHKGTNIEDIDDGYLQWLLETELREPLLGQIEAELETRRKKAAAPMPAPTIHFPAHLEDFAEAIILAGFRECGIKYTKPAELKALEQARHLLEKFAGLA